MKFINLRTSFIGSMILFSSCMTTVLADIPAEHKAKKSFKLAKQKKSSRILLGKSIKKEHLQIILLCSVATLITVNIIYRIQDGGKVDHEEDKLSPQTNKENTLNVGLQSNKTGAPYLDPKTDREIVTNLVHAAYHSPRISPRGKNYRRQCVDPLKESLFRLEKPYLVFLEVMKTVAPDIATQKKILIEDTLGIRYKKYDIGNFEEIWTKEFPIPKNFDDMIGLGEIKGEKDGYSLTSEYIGKDGKKGAVCVPTCANKDSSGGYVVVALAWEEKTLIKCPAMFIHNEFVKYKIERKAIQNGATQEEARSKRLIIDRAYILANVPIYVDFDLYCSDVYQEKKFSEIKELIKPLDRKQNITNFTVAAAPDTGEEHGKGAAKESGKYNIAQVKQYVKQCWIAIKAEQEFFIESNLTELLYAFKGHIGAGAFSHSNLMPYLGQPLACYFAKHHYNLTNDQIRAVYHPYDPQRAIPGLKAAKKLWKRVIKAATKNGETSISFERMCQLWISESAKMGSPLRFKPGDGN